MKKRNKKATIYNLSKVTGLVFLIYVGLVTAFLLILFVSSLISGQPLIW